MIFVLLLIAIVLALAGGSLAFYAGPRPEVPLAGAVLLALAVVAALAAFNLALAGFLHVEPF